MPEINYRPLFGRVLIKREVANKSNGVIIPETIAKRHARCEGKVIAKGATAEGVELGDHVIFGRNAGAWLDNTYSMAKTAVGGIGVQDNNDGTLFICQDEDILAVVEA